MVYEPSARVLHRIGPRAAPTPRQIQLRDTNRGRMVAQHYDAAERLRFALWFYPTRAIHLTRYLFCADLPRARAILDGTLGSIGDSRGPAPLRSGPIRNERTC